jgi:hypothetical protein
MIILKDRGIALKTYNEAKSEREIGNYKCCGKEIDGDTVIVYEMFDERIEETGSLAKDHELATLWFCTAHVFCKCGTYHDIKSEIPVEEQMFDIVLNVHGREGISFVIPSEGPEGFLIAPVFNKEKVKKRIADIKKWL